MKTLFIPLAAAVLLFSTGCETVAPEPVAYVLPVDFTESDLEAYKVKGAASLSGQAFLKTRGGDVKVGAGEKISLYPETPYTTLLLPLLARNVRPTNYTEAIEAAIAAASHHVIADAEGRFEFTDLPAGDYIAFCEIYWDMMTGYGLTQTGSAVIKHITIGDAEEATVMLTQ